MAGPAQERDLFADRGMHGACRLLTIGDFNNDSFREPELSEKLVNEKETSPCVDQDNNTCCPRSGRPWSWWTACCGPGGLGMSSEPSGLRMREQTQSRYRGLVGCGGGKSKSQPYVQCSWMPWPGDRLHVGLTGRTPGRTPAENCGQ